MESLVKQVILPPKEIFIDSAVEEILNKTKKIGGTELPTYRETICAAENSTRFPDGGIYSYYDNEPFPRKGHPFLEAVMANATLKRLTLQMLMSVVSKEMVPSIIAFGFIPYRWKIRWLEKFLANYNRLIDSVMRNFYLKPLYYNPCSQELKVLTEQFLQGLGISRQVAEDTGRAVATIFEYDDAYRYRLEDIFSEVTQEQLISYPRKTLKKMSEVFVERDLGDREDALGQKVLSVFKVLSVILIFPKIRRAFIRGIKAVKFRKLQLDVGDTYYAFNRPDYNYKGVPWTERKKIHDQIRRDFIINT